MYQCISDVVSKKLVHRTSQKSNEKDARTYNFRAKLPKLARFRQKHARKVHHELWHEIHVPHLLQAHALSADTTTGNANQPQQGDVANEGMITETPTTETGTEAMAIDTRSANETMAIPRIEYLAVLHHRPLDPPAMPLDETRVLLLPARPDNVLVHAMVRTMKTTRKGRERTKRWRTR